MAEVSESYVTYMRLRNAIRDARVSGKVLDDPLIVAKMENAWSQMSTDEKSIVAYRDKRTAEKEERQRQSDNFESDEIDKIRDVVSMLRSTKNPAENIEKIKKLLRWVGFQDTKSGGTRVVVLLGRRVAKIDMSYGARFNNKEASRWDEHKNEAPICEVRVHDNGRVAVAPRASFQFKHHDQDGMYKEREAALRQMKRVLPRVLDANYPFNWGIFDGKVLCFDYSR